MATWECNKSGNPFNFDGICVYDHLSWAVIDSQMFLSHASVFWWLHYRFGCAADGRLEN